MMKWLMVVSAAVMGVLVFHLECLSALIFFVGCIAAVLLGTSSVITVKIFLSRKHRSRPKLPPEIILIQKMNLDTNLGEHSAPCRPPVVISRSVDVALQKLMDHIIQDYIVHWFKDLAFQHQNIVQMLKDDLWIVIVNLQERLRKIDQVKFITSDIISTVTQHFEKIRLAQTTVESKDKLPTFILSPYLCDDVKEIEFLRKVSELLLITLLPRSYVHCIPVRHLLREILACSVLHPAVELLCDPDYLNQKLLEYVHQHEAALALHQRTYTYAASYEDFIHMIQECSDIDDLKHIRYNIMTEIMHATTINNLKKAKGLAPDKETAPQSMGKGDLLQARNLKRYINQLTYAKSQCEKRLRALGGVGYSSDNLDLGQDPQLFPGRKVLSFQVVMESVFTRHHFYRFLERELHQGLLGYWGLVEELRHAERKLWHQLGAEIFYTYIHSQSSVIKVDKSILKRMEGFLMGDKGPEVFFELQEEVLKNLEHKHYPSFIVSDVYQNMLASAEEVGIDFMHSASGYFEEPLGSSDTAGCGDQPAEGSMQLLDHSNYAKTKLDQLDEKLTNKMQALQALRASLKPESKLLTMLEKEVEKLVAERGQLEIHIERTEAWSEHLGKWRAQVQSAEISDEKEPPYFNLIVHLPGNRVAPSTGTEYWGVIRKVSDLQDLHRKLCQQGPWVKSLDLPSQSSKSLFSKVYDKAYLDKARVQLQKYLDYVLGDEKLNKSEVLYAFLSPSPEHLKQTLPSLKKGKFFLTTFFKSSSGSDTKDSDDDDSLLMDEMDSSKGEDKRDSIAEPLYTLIGEVFDMRGVFKWLRKTLITFVQITYGRTINRQLRETVSWLFSEPMILYYIHLFTNSWWPNGELASPAPPCSDDQKLRKRYEAREQFLNNIPEVLSNLVGQQSARRGAIKVFETLQDVRLNKQLFYDILEVTIYELCPEIKTR